MHSYKGFLGGSVKKNPLDNAGDMGLISGSGRSPRKGNGNPLQYSWVQWMISHVISAWSVTWSLHEQSRDTCVISLVISA